jgi:hypothetical protein
MDNFEIETDQNGHVYVALTDKQTLFYNRDKDSYTIKVKNNDGSVTIVNIPAHLLDTIYNHYWDNLKD